MGIALGIALTGIGLGIDGAGDVLVFPFGIKSPVKSLSSLFSLPSAPSSPLPPSAPSAPSAPSVPSAPFLIDSRLTMVRTVLQKRQINHIIIKIHTK